MKERLIEFLAYLDMGQTKFEEKVGLSRGFVNKIGESIKLKTIKKITDVYPELNANWLKTGEGEMLKSGGSTPSSDQDVVSVPINVWDMMQQLIKTNASQQRTIEELSKKIHGSTAEVVPIVRANGEI
ncbi:MAG: hypothetical protein LBQ73_09675 [Tannerellaceae bacterium]|jgi:hypothetical protein|nr:hypothetical protein [Tannerellaceae bacterium]